MSSGISLQTSPSVSALGGADARRTSMMNLTC
jgi:hypothetical protein